MRLFLLLQKVVEQMAVKMFHTHGTHLKCKEIFNKMSVDLAPAYDQARYFQFFLAPSQSRDNY